MHVFITEWSAVDRTFESDEKNGSHCEVVGWGKTVDGISTCIRAKFTPFFFVQVPATHAISPSMATGFMHTVISRLRNRCLAHKCRVIERKPYHGYQGGRTRHFVQLVFSSMRDFRSAKYACKEANWATFESACDPLLKFFHVNKLDPVGWTHVDNPIPVMGDEKTARPNVSEWTVASFRDISMSTDSEVIATIPPLVIASWDIECVSAKGGFPDGANPEDKLITIGTAYMKYGESEPFKNTVHQLKSCDPVEGVEIHAYEAEQDLINAWIEEIGEMHVDVLLGFNVWGFDSKYIDDRSTCLIDFRTGDSAVNLSLFGKAVDGGGERVEKQLQSAAYGSNKYIFHATPGVVQLDLLTIFRKELKLASYTLNNVAKTYLGGEEKIDLKPKEIFECFKGTSADRARIAEYCVRDCALPLYLMNKLNVLTNQLEMSKVVCCPVSFLNLRGQQIRCYSQIVRKAREHGFVVDDFDKKGGGGGFTGATVLEPQAGAYMMDIVSCLDFGSLYPSIIRAHKMDLSTIVNEPVYDHLDGVEYYRVETTPGKIVTFAQTDDAVVPALLDDLAAWRTQAKRDMAGAKERGDAFAASLYNAKQLAYKVSSNSVYGLFGSATGMLPCVDMASAVTSTGRDMIQTTKAKVMEYNPGARVVYGDTDSVFVIFNCGQENRQNLAAHMKMAQEMADRITTCFRRPNILEYEKCYFPWLLFSKKRYCGLMFETDPDKSVKIDVKGLQVVRRDNCGLVREVSQEVMDILMYKRSFSLALDHARKRVLDVLNEKVSWDSMVVSKALRGNYKNPKSLPHWQVAEKRKARGEAITSGERIPYVFIRDPLNSDGLVAERAEDPVFAKTNGLPLDTLYYVRQQLLNPICTLLSPQYADPSKEILGEPDIAVKMLALQVEESANVKESKRVKRLKKENQREITSFFSKKVKE